MNTGDETLGERGKDRGSSPARAAGVKRWRGRQSAFFLAFFASLSLPRLRLQRKLRFECALVIHIFTICYLLIFAHITHCDIWPMWYRVTSNLWDRKLPFFAKVLFYFLLYMWNILCTIDNKLELFCWALGMVYLYIMATVTKCDPSARLRETNGPKTRLVWQRMFWMINVPPNLNYCITLLHCYMYLARVCSDGGMAEWLQMFCFLFFSFPSLGAWR